MSATAAKAATPQEPFLILPGFMPDAIGYAVRTTVSLLLAYGVAFMIQLDSASSAGVCVAIVSQPTPGMALSKAVYRTIGTVLGGVVALAFIAAFAQNRTMLLLSFTLWLGVCTFVAALLRDFRSYGAVLCGYTVGIIAVSGIDTPDGALLATLNRVAAILLGVASVAVVNTLFARPVAFEQLVTALTTRLTEARTMALAALAGQEMPREPLTAQIGAAILALRTEANYAAAELTDGRRRRAGGSAAIAGLLGMLSASRALSTGLRTPADPPTRRALDDAAAALTGSAPPPPLSGLPADPHSAALLDRSRELLIQHALAEDGLRTLRDGEGDAVEVTLPEYHDWVGAVLSAARTIIAVGLGCVFCVYAGWPGATLLLVQQAAFTALLGMQPNPSAAGITMGLSLPLPALAAGIIGFLLLPAASGFVPFALALAPFAFAAALVARHPLTARFGAGSLLYLTLLLAPANTESFDLQAYFGSLLVQIIAVLFMVLAFHLILPVSRKRRLLRVADSIVHQLRRALAGRPMRLDPIAARCLRVDRLAQAQVWLGRATPARLAVLERLSAFSELASALRRARVGLGKLGRPWPSTDPDALDAVARGLLAEADTAKPEDVLHAAAGLHGAAFMLRKHGRALRRYGILRD
jgi:uncharacterized membrane protein YccC